MMKTLRFCWLCLLSVLCSATAWAYDFEVDGIYYNVDASGTPVAVVTHGDWDPNNMKAGEGYSGDIVLPATVKFRNRELKVTKIGDNAFQNCKSLTSIDLNNVTTIGYAAFYDCGLTSIDFKNVTTIGSYAFYRDDLTSLDLKNVTKIGDYAFQHCAHLTSIDFQNLTEISYHAFNSCTSLTSIDFKNVEIIHANAFYGCKKLNSIDFKNVKKISSGAFEECVSLTSIDLKNVNEVERHAFGGCKGLTSIDLGKVETLASSCFTRCEKLKTVNLRNVSYILDDAFRECENIELIKTSEKNPPRIYNTESFAPLAYLATVQVPTGCKEAYQNANIWNKFAEFVEEGEIAQVLLTAQCNEGGRIDFASTTITNDTTTVSVNKGEKVEMTFVAEKGYELKSVVVNGKEVTADVVDGKYTVTMDAKTNVVVTFEKLPIYLTIKYADCGELKQLVNEGASFSFVVAAAEGWKINAVTFNDADVTSELDADHKYTTPAITANAVLNVTFETEIPSSVEEYSANRISVRGYQGSIVVEGADRGDEIKVYTMDGALVAAQVANGGNLQINVAKDQVYVVKVGQRTFKLSL